MKEFGLPFLFAVLAGVLAGWGVGGGTLLLLCMTLILGVEQRAAQTINLLFFLPTAAVSTYFNRKKGEVDGDMWRRLAIPGTIAALAASLAALAVDATLLRKPFGVFLLWSGWSVLRGKKNKS